MIGKGSFKKKGVLTLAKAARRGITEETLVVPKSEVIVKHTTYSAMAHKLNFANSIMNPYFTDVQSSVSAISFSFVESTGYFYVGALLLLLSKACEKV